MSSVTLRGNPISIGGTFPVKGDKAPAFTLVAKDLSDVSLSSLTGKRKILNIFPSVDTPVCATSIRTFNASPLEHEWLVKGNIKCRMAWRQQ